MNELRLQSPAVQAELAQMQAERAKLLEDAATQARAESAAAGRGAVTAGLSQAASNVGTALSNVPGAGLVRGVRNWWSGKPSQVAGSAAESVRGAAGSAVQGIRGAAGSAVQNLGDYYQRTSTDEAANAAVGFVPYAPQVPAPQPGMMRYQAPYNQAEAYGAAGETALGAAGRLGRNIDNMGYEAYPGVQSLY